MAWPRTTIVIKTLRAVAWSFLGLRNSGGLEEDTKLNPLHVVIVGFLAVIAFVVFLLGLVHWVV